MNSYNSLLWLNFFVADVRDGLGPYLGVFLKSHGLKEGAIGIIASVASLCALIFSIPFGILVDKTRHKRTLIALCIILIISVTSFNYFYTHFAFTLIAQVSIALCAVFLAPAFAAITLGIVGLNQYALQVAKNEAYKHAGTAFSAALSFIFALYYGIGSIFVITALMGVFSLIFLYLIKECDINHKVASGQSGDRTLEFGVVFKDMSVWILGIVMFCFHLSNAHMLPLLSQRAHSMGVDSTGAYAAGTIIIAQSSMIFIALLCGRLLRNDNYRIYSILMSLCFVGLMLRGVVAAYFDSIGAMVVVQILDGVGAGISGVILPVLVAFWLNKSGHINAGFAFVMMLGGIGGALSSTLGGIMAESYGYLWAYLTLAFVAFIGLVVWLVYSRKRFVLV